MYRGQQWVSSHSAQEIAETVAPSFPDSDTAILAAVVQRYQGIGAWNTDPAMSEESFGLLQEVMTQAGELTKKAPYDQVVNNRFAEKVRGE